MNELHCLRTIHKAKLLNKVKNLHSTNLESVNSQSAKTSRNYPQSAGSKARPDRWTGFRHHWKDHNWGWIRRAYFKHRFLSIHLITYLTGFSCKAKQSPLPELPTIEIAPHQLTKLLIHQFPRWRAHETHAITWVIPKKPGFVMYNHCVAIHHRSSWEQTLNWLLDESNRYKLQHVFTIDWIYKSHACILLNNNENSTPTL